ncbi:hypothetical protein [Actinokineospora inagensis]|uniref:hypothetical protein n=1 Tax=Actinokineospora inagensis TaxID=103730 RepID=UPI0012FA2AF2|nr:hypothetical protein [Actinokineospora inagensis]
MEPRVNALPCPQPWRNAAGTANPAGAPATVEADGVPGLLLPSRTKTVAAGVILLVVGLVFGTLGGLLIAGGTLLVGIGGGILGVLGVMLAAAGVFALTRKQRAVGIVLTQEHIVLNWVRPAVRLPWATITEVRPLALRAGQSSPSRSYLGLAARDLSHATEGMRRLAVKFGPDLACAVQMTTMDVDQLLVLHTLRYYLANPGARAELTGEEAVRRVAAGQVRTH